MNEDEFRELFGALQRGEMPGAVGEMKPHIGEIVLELIGPFAWKERIMPTVVPSRPIMVEIEAMVESAIRSRSRIGTSRPLAS